jgi:hypothetical protein
VVLRSAIRRTDRTYTPQDCNGSGDQDAHHIRMKPLGHRRESRGSGLPVRPENPAAPLASFSATTAVLLPS